VLKSISNRIPQRVLLSFSSDSRPGKGKDEKKGEGRGQKKEVLTVQGEKKSSLRL